MPRSMATVKYKLTKKLRIELFNPLFLYYIPVKESLKQSKIGKNKNFMPLIILLFIIFIQLMPPALACTDFQLKTTNGTVIAARSMEWGVDMKSQLRTYPRQQERQSTAPDGHAGLSWQAKYGYVGANCYDRDMVIDGMNEKGLSVGGLWFPGASYPKANPQQYKKAINVLDLGSWMLGNFASVDEVKSALMNVVVWADSAPEVKGIPTIHFAVHDALGKNAVIEFTDRTLKFYDNPNGVLTNAPSFDWHITNLCNYLMLDPANPKPVTIGSTILSPPGQGSGFMGIPGDWTPPSRFVRVTAMLRYAKPVEDATAGVNLAEHTLNAVDIPLGNVRPADRNIDFSDYTQWALIKDLTNRVLYFRSYNKMQLQAIDLQQIDFSPGVKIKVIPIAETMLTQTATFK